jgi:hypothetical protein
MTFRFNWILFIVLIAALALIMFITVGLSVHVISSNRLVDIIIMAAGGLAAKMFVRIYDSAFMLLLGIMVHAAILTITLNS